MKLLPFRKPEQKKPERKPIKEREPNYTPEPLDPTNHPD